jgi:hypothetical protein
MQAFVKGIIDSVKKSFYRWRQIGPHIKNSPQGTAEYFGDTTQISGDGKVIAVWIPKANVFNTRYNGAVKTYRVTGNGNWVQIGQQLQSDQAPVGANDGIWFGEAIALNETGTRMAISAPFYNRATTSNGRVTVYDFINNQWVLIGTFLGSSGTTRTNYGICFNSSGSRLAFHAGGGDYPQFKVFEYNGTQWTQIGATIQEFGSSARLNAEGNILFAGRGIYALQSGTWTIFGSWPVENFGSNGYAATNTPSMTQIDATGYVLIVLYTTVVQVSGSINTLFVRRYAYINSAWVQTGQPISFGAWAAIYVNSQGNATTVYFTESANPKLSQSGNRLITNGNYVKPGQVITQPNQSTVFTDWLRTYDFVNGEWVIQNQTIIANSDSFGASCGLSSDGKTLVYGKGGEDSLYGIVDVYRKELD